MHKLTNLPQVCHHWVCVRGACNCAASQRQRVCYPAVRLVKTGRYPRAGDASQRALDIDALIELAQPVAYVIHGENHAELARQMAHKHACLRHVLVAGETVSDDFTPLFSLHGERQAWPQPDVSATALLLLSGGTTGTPKLIPRRHADYSYNFSASAELCGISQQSVYLAVLPVAHNFPLACPGILGNACLRRKSGADRQRQL